MIRGHTGKTTINWCGENVDFSQLRWIDIANGSNIELKNR
jgi:hypothetical protein